MFRGGPPEGLDHLIYLAQDLDAACSDLERRTGVRPVRGGTHPQYGTHNALLGLGPRMYLEVLSPDPAAASFPGRELFGFERPPLPRLATWCAAVADLDEHVARAEARGANLGLVEAGGRRRPDGSEVHWRITPPLMQAGGLVPFFIQWGDAAHPATGAPAGCRLRRLEAEHPDPESVWKLLNAVGVELFVSRGPRARLVATIDCPAGAVTLV